MVKISGVVITFNEESNIARCLDSMLDVTDEIVVVDSFSSDRTKEICLSRGVRFVEHPFRTHIDQKNFGLTQATYSHVLSLDADEYLSEDLKEAILEVKQKWPAEAYRMNRLSSYGNRWIKHGAWYPDRKIRLWNRSVGFWGGENPHDKVILKAGTRVKHLEGNILHRAYRDCHSTIEKVQRYSEIFAHENSGKEHSSIFRILVHTLWAFTQSYFVKRGFLDGFEGLMVAMAEANHVFYKYAKLYEGNLQLLLGKRIVISRTDNIGDVILTLPLVGYIKSQRPDTEIFFIGKSYTQSVISRCAHIHKFLDRQELLADPSKLQRLNADSILFVYPDRQLAQLAKAAKIPNRVATGHRWHSWLYCNYRVDFSRIHSNQHESLLNFKLLSPFKMYWDLDVKEMAPLYGLEPELKKHDALLGSGRFNLILHPKSKGSAREWHLENYYQLAKLLPPSEYQIFVTGLKEEGDAIRRERPELFKLEHVTDMTGKLSLDELMSFIVQADGLVACSTGVLHLASSLGKFALGLYSPMRPIHPGRWMPIGAKASYLVINRNCSDCKQSKECHCVNEITPQQVHQRISQFAAANVSNRYVES
jgi:heptosyltransferase-3